MAQGLQGFFIEHGFAPFIEHGLQGFALFFMEHGLQGFACFIAHGLQGLACFMAQGLQGFFIEHGLHGLPSAMADGAAIKTSTSSIGIYRIILFPPVINIFASKHVLPDFHRYDRA
ncbi:MAG: hypothetical protein R8K46_03055 [Mariprofundaceae bacterium]